MERRVKFVLSVEEDPSHGPCFVMRDGAGLILGKCCCRDNPSSPSFWVDSSNNDLVDCNSVLATRLSDVFNFVSRVVPV